MRIRTAAIAVVTLLATLPLGAGGLISSTYGFELVQGYTGGGGAEFTTELCLDNPWEHDLVVLIGVMANGQPRGAMNYLLRGWDTVCLPDVLRNMLDVTSGNGTLIVGASEDDNPSGNREFSASVRLMRTTDRGAVYAREIAPMQDGTKTFNYLFDDAQTAWMTGVQNYITAGDNGFRTKVGLANLTPNGQTVEVGVWHNDGWVVFEERWLPPYTVTQFFLSDSLTLYDGTVYVGYAAGVAPYIEIFDRKTGDGVHRGPLIIDPDELMVKAESWSPMTEMVKNLAAVAPLAVTNDRAQKNMHDETCCRRKRVRSITPYDNLGSRARALSEDLLIHRPSGREVSADGGN